MPPLAVDQPPFAFYGALLGAAGLLGAGAPVALVDAFGEAIPEGAEGGWIRLGPPVERFCEALASLDSDLVVIHQPPLARLERNLGEVLGPLLGALASPGRTIVLSDGHLTDTHYVSMEPAWVFSRFPEVDYLALREPELPLAALWEGKAHPRLQGRAASSPGLGQNRQTASWEGLPYLADVTRMSAWLNAPQLRDLLPGHDGKRAIFPYLASRGCPHRCSFCTREPGRSFAGLPIEQVRRELTLLQVLGIEEVWLLDPIANAQPGRFGELLDLLLELGLGLVVTNGLRLDRLDPSILGRLARLCRRVPLSVESWDPEVQRSLGKGLSLDRAREILEQAKEVGLPVEVHYLLGVPGESAEAANRSLAMALEAEERWGARPLLQFHVPPSAMAVPGPDGLGLPGDFYSSFSSRPLPAPGALAPDRIVRLKDSFERKRLASAQSKLIINLTYRCVNQCVFCSVGDRPVVDGALHRQLQVLEEASRQGIRLLDLDGGEPTLYPGLFDVIDRALALGYQRITVTTNGRRLDDGELLGELGRRGVELLVSLHGQVASVHDALTRSPGSFRETWAGLRLALRRLDQVGVNTTVVAGNLEQLPGLAEKLAAAGVTRWNIQCLTPFGRAQGRADLCPPMDVLGEELQRLLVQIGPRMEVTVVGLPPCALGPFEGLGLDDHHKAVRLMLFATGEEVNLGAYLGERRAHEERCLSCERRLLCGGFWRFSEPTTEEVLPSQPESIREPPDPPGEAISPSARAVPEALVEGPHRRAPGLGAGDPVKMLDLIPGYACNLVCDYCSVTEEMRGVAMGTSEALQHLHQGRAHGIDYVSFGGGEPTIRHDILRLTRAAHRLGYSTIRYQTNGLLFAYPDFTERAIAAGLNRVHISFMTAREALYDRITGLEGSLGVVLEGLRKLKARGIPVVGDLIVKSDTFGHLGETVAFYHGHGVEEFYLWLVSLTDRNRDNLDSLRPVAEMRPYIEEALDYGRRHGIRVMSRHIPACMLPGREDQVVRLGDEDVWVVTPRSSFWLLESVISANRFGPRCEPCSRKGVCWGLREDYLVRYGDGEVVPYIEGRGDSR